MKRTFLEKLRGHPIVAVWSMVWLVVAMLNFGAGIKTGGFALALAFVSIAMLGAYAAAEWERASGGRRIGLGALIVLQLLLGQWCGWQTLGINLSQGATGLDNEATTHNSASDELKKAKDERESLGSPRTIAAIQADENLECESGVGPKCTALRKELADAQRAADLDAKIPELVRDLGAAPQLTDANSPYKVAMSLGSVVGSAIQGKKVEASREDVIFWFEIFITALLEFVGTCGPWLFQIGVKWADPEERQPPRVDDWDFGPRRITHQQSNPAAGSSYLAGGAHHPVLGDFQDGGAGSPAGAHNPAGADGLYRPPQTPASNSPIPAGETHQPNLHQQGAPITVNLYGQPQASHPVHAGPQPTPLIPLDMVADNNVRALRSAVRQPMTPAIEQSVREAPEVPVDRSTLQNTLDGLLVFKAREIVEQPGAWTAASSVYERYADWAKERAISADAFHTLFPAATRIDLKDLGGVKHYAGVALHRVALAKEAS